MSPATRSARALTLAALLLPVLPHGAFAQESNPSTGPVAAPAEAAPTPPAGAEDGAEPAAAQAAPPVEMGEWMSWSSIIEPTKYADGFEHYDYVNPEAPKGGTLNLIPGGETFDSFNPFVVRGTPAAGLTSFGGMLYDTLMPQALDEPGVRHALIAEAISAASDYSAVSFRIDPDARWHDGEPITVEDVIWSFETLTEINPLYDNYYRNVVSAEETGEREVTFRFDQANNRELPDIMGDLAILPKHYWEADGRDITQPTLTPPLGSGPYRIGSFDPGSRIVWERVEDYWAANEPSQVGRNNYDTVRYTYFRDENAAWQAFVSGGYEDYRIENRAQRWAQGYNFPAFAQGRVRKLELPDGGVQAMQGWVLNTRRPQLQDPKVRKALTLAFNFQDLDRNLFYGLYDRADSFFQNSELAAAGLPEGKELEVLEAVRADVPAELFTEPFTLPDYNRPGAERDYLRQAFDLLQEAGWSRQGSRLVDASGRAFTLEFLTADQNSTRTIEPYANSLRRLGIDVTIRVADTSQYIARVQSFDFDVITSRFGQTLSPGNEQREFWSTPAASQPGSRNVAGIQNPAVDAIIERIIYAPDRETLVGAVRALDRVLLWNHYVVPQWYNSEIRLGIWDKLVLPDAQPEAYAGIDPFSWWVRPAAQAEPEPSVEELPEGATPPVEDAVPGGLTPAAEQPQ